MHDVSGLCIAGAAASRERVAQLLAAARRPLLVAGGGVNRAQGGAALTQLAERLQHPGSHYDDRPELDRRPARAFDRHHRRQRFSSARESRDGGGGPAGLHRLAHGSVVTIGWTFPSPRRERKIVQVEIGPDLLGNAAPNTLNIHGDARAVLEQLNALPRPRPMTASIRAGSLRSTNGGGASGQTRACSWGSSRSSGPCARKPSWTR